MVSGAKTKYTSVNNMLKTQLSSFVLQQCDFSSKMSRQRPHFYNPITCAGIQKSKRKKLPPAGLKTMEKKKRLSDWKQLAEVCENNSYNCLNLRFLSSILLRTGDLWSGTTGVPGVPEKHIVWSSLDCFSVLRALSSTGHPSQLNKSPDTDSVGIAACLYCKLNLLRKKYCYRMSDMLCYFIPTFDCPFSFFVGEVNGISALRHYLSLRATEKHN